MAGLDQAATLRSALGDAFGILDCKRALMRADGDLAQAANWLASGQWLEGKLVSFDVASLEKKARDLATEVGKPPRDCFIVVRNCAGNVELAKRVLAGLPVWPAV